MAEDAELSRLKALFDGALAGLEGVEAKRFFGWDAYFVGGNLFAMLWREGRRLGLRLDDAGARAELGAVEGCELWSQGGRGAQSWLLLPEVWHGPGSPLKAWCRRAWLGARGRPERSAVTRKRGGPKQVRDAQFPRLPRRSPGDRGD